MRRKIWLVIVSLYLSSVVGSIFWCQNAIEIQGPLRAQRLSGRVQLGDSPEGVPGVLVERCSRDWKTVKDSIHTDANGRFDFPNASKRHSTICACRFKVPTL